MKKAETRASLRTRYHGPSAASDNGRISAYRPGFSDQPGDKIFVSWDHGLNTDENHYAAAQAFARKFLRPQAEIVPRGLCFDNDFFWTWEGSEGAPAGVLSDYFSYHYPLPRS